MKKMKKILSMALVLVLALALAMPAFAAGEATDGTITINNAVAGKTYQAYRLFDLTLDAIGKNYGYTLNAEWKDFFTTGAGNQFVTIDPDNGNVTLADDSAASLQNLAQAAQTYAKDNVGAVTAHTPTGEAPNLTFSKLPLGYYLVTTDAGTLQALDTTNKNAVMYEKNTEPDINKTADKTNAAYGETVHFTIPVTKGGYAWGAYVIQDTMIGLELKPDSITVKVKNTPLTADTDYTVKSTTTSTTTALTVTIPEETLNKRNDGNTDFVYPAGTEFVLEYDAVAKATVSMENKVQLEYKHSPSAEPAPTTPHIVKVANYEFTLKKTDGDGAPLDGATFELHKNEQCTDGAMQFIKKDDTYRLAENGEEVPAGSVKTSTITAGTATIEGLAAGTYYLKEMEAPAGYNKLVNPVKVEIIETLNTTPTSPYYKQAFDDDGNRLAPTIEMNDSKVSESGFVLKIVNKTGTELPSTGGIGTTIFYVVGGILMVAAVVAFIVKKRMEQ